MDHQERKKGPPETFEDLPREQAQIWALQQETQLLLAGLRRDRETTAERLMSACLANTAGLGDEKRVAYRHELVVYEMIVGIIEGALGEATHA